MARNMGRPVQALSTGSLHTVRLAFLLGVCDMAPVNTSSDVAQTAAFTTRLYDDPAVRSSVGERPRDVCSESVVVLVVVSHTDSGPLYTALDPRSLSLKLTLRLSRPWKYSDSTGSKELGPKLK